MPSAPEQAAQQSETAVHAAATQASAALNKLAGELQKAGADKSTISHVDEMANTANTIASAVVGNPPAPSQPADLGSAIQDFHSQSVADAGGQPPTP